jgi:hypothetical protein
MGRPEVMHRVKRGGLEGEFDADTDRATGLIAVRLGVLAVNRLRSAPVGNRRIHQGCRVIGMHCGGVERRTVKQRETGPMKFCAVLLSICSPNALLMPKNRLNLCCVKI